MKNHNAGSTGICEGILSTPHLTTLYANVVETETNMSAEDVVIVTYVTGR